MVIYSSRTEIIKKDRNFIYIFLKKDQMENSGIRKYNN